MLKGQIININSNRYKVLANKKEYICTARGKFRNDKITPLVGDYVEFDENYLQMKTILPRKNFLNRPMVANVDIALIVTSVKEPNLDLNLLDKLLLVIYLNNIKPVVCFTKIDLLNRKENENFSKIRAYYSKYYDVIDNTELQKFEKIAHGKTTILCGQTGAGKSTFINKIDPRLKLDTNEISKALGRGVHTTRMVSLYDEGGYFICDSPGFSSISLESFTKEDIRNGFIEFSDYNCKYRDCNHINTEGCQVENNEKILLSRYENYVNFIKELNESSSKLFK